MSLAMPPVIVELHIANDRPNRQVVGHIGHQLAAKCHALNLIAFYTETVLVPIAHDVILVDARDAQATAHIAEQGAGNATFEAVKIGVTRLRRPLHRQSIPLSTRIPRWERRCE